jgi:branched-chain amino acid transport system ATP-binding protein
MPRETADAGPDPLLEFRDVNTYYGDMHALKDVNYRIGRGEIVSLLGGNACGKSTTMKTIMGVVRPTTGTVIFDGAAIEGLPTSERVRRGIVPVLEARRLFPRMTVYENLEMGAYTRKRGPEFGEDLDRVYSLFPRVKERQAQLAGTLSGGEQQMVAIGRALMGQPRLLLLDEPSLGLAPQIITEIFSAIRKLRDERGLTVLLVEQNAQLALSVADYGYIMERGRIVLDDTPQKLLANDDVKEFYLGVQDGGERRSMRDIKHYKRRKRWLS